jgi:hypothetical protein
MMNNKFKCKGCFVLECQKRQYVDNCENHKVDYLGLLLMRKMIICLSQALRSNKHCVIQEIFTWEALVIDQKRFVETAQLCDQLYWVIMNICTYIWLSRYNLTFIPFSRWNVFILWVKNNEFRYFIQCCW